MEITLERFFHGNEDTLGRFNINNQFKCYTLEDEHRDVFSGRKVYGETRIPEGRYKIIFLTSGKHHKQYSERFGMDFHKGMLLLQDVPKFEGILIHIGNTDTDTSGCILVGSDCIIKGKDKKNMVTGSTIAYKKIYPEIRDALVNNEEVWITIK